MKEHLAQLRTWRKHYEDIFFERATREAEAEAEETERLSVRFFLIESLDY